MKILVTGASGYIAGGLIPRLLERGHSVRALARRPHLLHNRGWFDRIQAVRGDVMDPASLAPALQGIHTAYYLVHSMASGEGYTEREREGALNFARASELAGLQHIIYLGGLADHRQSISSHLSSRIETGQSLRQGKVPVTEFRAGVIAGSGSISFEMIRFTTEFFSIIPASRWLKNQSQPIAVQNVMDYLLAALEHWDGSSRVYEIGGPQITNYLDLMLTYARVRGLKRRVFLLPFVPVRLMALGVNLMTPVTYPIAHALVGGLSNDSVVIREEARAAFPQVRLIDFESAARAALGRLHPLRIERIWDDGQVGVKLFKHEGFFIDHRTVQLEAEPGRVFRAVLQVAGRIGWPFAACAPAQVGETLKAGDRIGACQVDACEPARLLLLRSRRRTPGDAWMEWSLAARDGGTRLSQTAFFAPRGLPGFLHWSWLRPFRALSLRSSIRAISARARRA